jgi:DNA modification methylase
MLRMGKLQLEYVNIDELIPFSGNPRTIKESGLNKLTKSVEKFGFVNPILARLEDRTIIAGHQRLKAAKTAGLEKVPVIFLDFDETLAKAYNLADNRLQDETSWDDELLDELLAELSAADFEMEFTGFDIEEITRIIDSVPDAPEDELDEESDDDPIAQKGELYKLGRHYLMCGDSTVRANLDRLLAEIDAPSPHLIFTSPPYPGADMWETSGEQLIKVGDTILHYAADVLSEGGVLVWNTSDIPRSNHGYVCNIARDTMKALEYGLTKRGDIVWDKDVKSLPMPGAYRRPTVPNNTHEAILVFFKGKWKPRDKKGSLHADAMDWNRDTVWQIHTETQARKIGHKSPFPIEMAYRVLSLWSLPDDIVLDPFLGSGTTLIAAEKMGRTCLGCEIEPKYVDLTIRRWEEFTKQKAVKIHG